jgi:hypothetical protein
MKTNNTSGGGGIGFMGMLAIVFIALKLMKVITWSWWWVLAFGTEHDYSVVCVYCGGDMNEYATPRELMKWS